MASSRKKTETVEQKLDRWLAGSISLSLDKVLELGWEPGQSGHVTVDGVNYETFEVPGGYVVVEWDLDGNFCIC